MAEISIKNKEENKQIGILNFLRFLAAFSVMFYHYTYMFYNRGLSYINFPLFRYIFKYGFLGVQLFFIISGFVISLSAERKDVVTFIKSRMIRLYPALWVCVSITFVFFLFLGKYHYSHVSFLKYLANLTLVPTLFRSSIIDGSYWSLAVELKFYAFIALLLIINKFDNLKYWIHYLAYSYFFYILLFRPSFDFGSYFIAGMIFYIIYKNQIKLKYILGLISCYLVSLYYNYIFVSIDNTKSVNFYIMSTYVTIFFLIFLLISIKKLNIKNTKLLTIFGGITYPLYLLHQEIGLMIFKFFEVLKLNYVITFILVICFIISLSYFIHKKLENKIKNKLKLILDNTENKFISLLVKINVKKI